MPDVNMQVELAGVTLKNPVVVASGTFGFGREYGQFYDLSELGGICCKGLTLHPCLGNDGIRVWETASGVMNSVGMENPGIQHFIDCDLERMNALDLVNIVNMGGHSEEDYLEGVELLNQHPLDLLELNISCPNTKAGCMSFGLKAEVARDIVKKVRAICKHKLVVKLSPNVTDITEIAKAVEGAGADALSLINTIRGMRIDVNTRRPVLKMNTGGLSGPAVLPVAVRMVWEVAQAVSLPILGMGGVSKGEEGAQLMLAGASAVAVGTALFADPFAPLKVRDGLAEIAARQGLSAVSELTGGVKPW